MAKLILSMDGLVLKEIPLTKERTTIGRKPHNDIQIDNLAVSGEHAVIVTILNDSFLEDLGSTNGTVVNGNPIKKHFLQNNDVIELGKYKLKFVAEAAAAANAEKADFEKTMVLRPSVVKPASAVGTTGPQLAQPGPQLGQTRSHVAETASPLGQTGTNLGQTASQPAVAQRQPVVQAATAGALTMGAGDKEAKAAPGAVAPATSASVTAAAAAPSKPGQSLGAIQLLSGANAGKEVELIKPLTTLGKPGVQVAVLTRRPQGYFITHVEGEKRPSVNGEEIGAAPHSLKDHDVIELAGVKMEFFLKA
ncbi:MAG: FHA domain-containing protein [Burkholderiales bacterium]